MESTSNTKVLSSMSTPDPLASNEEKKSPEYGLKYALAIQSEWFHGGITNKSSTFMGRHQWVRDMRKYHRGEQDIQRYKDIAARQQEDLDWLNLDWTPINVVEKYDNIVANGISDEFYRLDVRSADRFSLLQREKRVLEHKKNMATKDMLEKAKALGLPDLTPQGFVPEDEEELDLYSEIKERPKQEIAEEIMINFSKRTSSWDYIKKQADKDLVINDLMVARVYTDPMNGVQVEYVDPEAYGHSYVERNDFKDAFYHFVVDTITINDLRRESNFNEMDIREIAKSVSSYNNGNEYLDYNTVPLNTILNYKVHVMRFCFKSDKEIIMKKYLDKKNRTKKVAIRDSNYQPPEGSENSRLSKRMDTWYEGNYVVDSNKFIYDYKESENLAKDSMDRVMPPFIAQSTNIYKNKLKSFLSNIIPLADQMQYAHLKIQHLMAELKPDLIELDLDQLAELNTDTTGESKSSNWKTALSILNTKGVVIKQRINMGEDGIKDGASARPMANQQGSALAALLNIWAHYYNLIRDVTGINPARDGTLSADALVGVNQMMQLASNTSTKHIVDAAVSWDKRVCETISARLKGIFSFKEAEHLHNMYEQAVGKENVMAMKSLKDRSIYEFGFTIEMVPAKEELDELKGYVNMSIEQGSLDISEATEILRIARSNIKQAHEYMRFLRRRRIKERMKEQEYNQKLQTQSNAQAAQTKQKGDMQMYQMKAQVDLQKKVKESAIKVQEQAQLNEVNAPIRQQEFKQTAYLEQMKNLQTINLTKYKEDAKGEREKENSTRQSKMIEQRQKDLGAFDFSNKFDLESLLN